jgi:hypothetical protein
LYIAGGDIARGVIMLGVIMLAQDPRKNRQPSSPVALLEARLLERWQAAVKGRESARSPEAEQA